MIFNLLKRVPRQTTTRTSMLDFSNATENSLTDYSYRWTTTGTSILDFSNATENASTDYSYSYNESYGDIDYGAFTPCFYNNYGHYFLPALYSLFFFLGIVGNLLVLWVIACGVRLRSVTDVCLLNLAVADLLLVCSLPFLAHQARDQWLFGTVMCKVVYGAYYIGFYSGIFFITLMSIDRYLAIVHAVYAMRARTRSFGLCAAAITWGAGVLASFPELNFVAVVPYHSDKLECCPVHPNEDNRWNIFTLFKINILGLLVPLIIMIFCYTQIIRRLLHGPSNKKQAIRLVLVVVAAFICCWLPYNVASFMKALELLHVYTQCESSRAIKLALQATETVAYSHSCLNPILYVFVGQKFRRHLAKLMKRAPYRLCQFINNVFPQERPSGSVYSQTTSLDERSTAI